MKGMDEVLLRMVDARLTAEIHPSLLGRPMLEVAREKLDLLVLQWHQAPDWEGVVLAYKNEKLVHGSANGASGGSVGLILPFLPYVQINFRAHLLVFAPTIGCTLVGTVQALPQFKDDFIYVIVLGTFRARLPRKMVDSKYHVNFDLGQGEGEDQGGKESGRVKVGSEVQFVVEELVPVETRDKAVTIVGSMVGERCGIMSHE